MAVAGGGQLCIGGRGGFGRGNFSLGELKYGGDMTLTEPDGLPCERESGIYKEHGQA